MKKANFSKHLLRLFAFIFLLSNLNISAQNDTVLIDFGPESSISPIPWNNFSETEITDLQIALYDSKYKATPFFIELSDRFAGFNSQGVANPDASIKFPSTATIDSYYGNTVDFYGALEPSGAVLFSGLDPAKTYSFEIFGGRGATDNREAKYTLTGATTIDESLNPANNTNAVVKLSMTPKPDGTIELAATPGDANENAYKFYYMNAVKIIYEEITTTQPTLSVTSPNGGESYLPETVQTITWTGENLTEDINISYSSDNGSSWIDIKTVANNLTSYDWTIPNLPSPNYLIKLTSFVAEDISDANFEVMGELPKLDTVMIDFGPTSLLSDLPWNNITSSEITKEHTPLYDSQHKATPFGIKVVDRFSGFNDGGITDPNAQILFPSTATSDSYYGNSVDFWGNLEPTGGLEISGLDPTKTYTFVFYAGRVATDNRETKYTVEGLSNVEGNLNPSGNTDNTLELSTSPKADGTVIITVSPGDNNNNGYKFYYLNAMKIVYDDIDFAQPSLTITSPNGGEQYISSSTQTITWNEENLTEDVIISYSENNGSTWINLDTVAPGTNSLNWTIPLIPASTYLVKIKSFIAEDISDANFEVTGELPKLDTVMIDFGYATNSSETPWNNLENWNEGSEINNLKNSNNLQTPYNIEIIDRFTGINETGSNSPDAGLRMPSTATSDSYFGNTVDFSGIEPTGGFQFSELNPSKTYTFEVFGSRMNVGDNRETKYVFTGSIKDSVYINTANNESNNATISLTPNAEGIIKLIVSPGENNNNGYKFYYIGAVKLIYDEEDPLPASLTITNPNGSEDWKALSTQSIKWNTINIFDDISISYSTDNGANWNQIQTVDPTVTELDWTIPETESDECLIKVTAGSVEDLSDAVFSISSPDKPSMNITLPNGGEKWISGTPLNINWDLNLITEDISISYSTDNGTTWTEIRTVNPDVTSIKWTVASTISDECLIKIESGNYSDVSAANFSIIEKQCTNTIVILGSSTAAGAGPKSIDSAWVWRYSAALEELNSDYEVVNLAVGGYTTFKVVPTGTEFEDGISEVIDENKNVTKALTYDPYAIIINMPSNDANNYTADYTLKNLKIIYDYAGAHGVRTWIGTTQPRNFSDPAKIVIQQQLATEIPTIYGDYSLDFWTGFADENGKVVSGFDSGDGVHLNSDGHKLMFERVMQKEIHMDACAAPNSTDNGIIESSKISVFPNPANEYFTLSFTTNSHASVEVNFIDLLGRDLGSEKSLVCESGAHQITFSTDQFEENNSIIFALIRIESSNSTKNECIKLIID